MTQTGTVNRHIHKRKNSSRKIFSHFRIRTSKAAHTDEKQPATTISAGRGGWAEKKNSSISRQSKYLERDGNKRAPERAEKNSFACEKENRTEKLPPHRRPAAATSVLSELELLQDTKRETLSARLVTTQSDRTEGKNCSWLVHDVKAGRKNESSQKKSAGGERASEK